MIIERSTNVGKMHLGFLFRNSAILSTLGVKDFPSSPSDQHDISPSSMTTSSTSLADTSCWTCRRRRWKCDRTLPVCQKCISLQQHCLGYNKDRPLRWTHSVASRGRLMGKKVPSQEQGFLIVRLLNDPSLQDLSSSIRGYIAYCKWSH